MPHSEHQIALVLSAGKGERMGTPKALLPIDDEPWWEIQLSMLDTIPIDSLWVVSQTVLDAMGSNAPRAALAEDDAPMFESFLAGIRALRTDPPGAVFVLPVDVPAPGAATWRALREAAAPAAAPSKDDKHGHPLRMTWDLCAEILERTDRDDLPPDDRRLDTLLKDQITYVPTSDARAVTNLNTPEDLARFLGQ